MFSPFCPPRLRALALAAVLLASAALAEKSDRTKPWIVEADRPGSVDLQRQVVVFNGNVVVSQGTLVLRAERVEMRETPDGYRAASAVGSPGKQATWRQRRDGGDEVVEGNADRIEFDGRSDVLKLLGNGTARRTRGGAVADEVNGNVIVWDNTKEVFGVEGGATSPANPTGRVRLVLSPRVEAASAPPPRTPAGAGALAPSRSLEERR